MKRTWREVLVKMWQNSFQNAKNGYFQIILADKMLFLKNKCLYILKYWSQRLKELKKAIQIQNRSSMAY